MVVPLHRRHTRGPQHLRRVPRRLPKDGQWRRPLLVNVLSQQRAQPWHQVGDGAGGRVTGVDTEALGAVADPLRERLFYGVGERDGMLFDAVRIRALSVFEGVVYHCVAMDLESPCRPTLEVDARTLPGDLDAGPLLVTVADWRAMVGHDVADTCLPELKRKGRLVEHQKVLHIKFPTWTPAPS